MKLPVPVVDELLMAKQALDIAAERLSSGEQNPKPAVDVARLHLEQAFQEIRQA